MTKEEKELINEYVEQVGTMGSRQALDDLYVIVKKPLYRILITQHNNHHDIEDIIIETMGVVSRKASTLLTFKYCFNWIVKISKRLLKNLRKKEGRRDEIIQTMPIPIYSKTNEDSVLLHIELKKLTYDEQRLIFFKFYCKFKIDDISYILKVSRATVHRKLAELYDSLKEKL